MPELPEVETIRRGLTKFVMQQRITGVEVRCKKSFVGNTREAQGRIMALRRYGKALVVDLDNGFSLMVHLRMTGQLIYQPRKGERWAAGHPSENFVAELPNRQTRVVLALAQGTLYFNDQRKFGFIKVLKTEEVEKDSFIRKLAPEPWQMSGAELHRRLQRHARAPVKAVILDQTVVCGLGNIYADEALYTARIHPQRRAGSILLAEAEALIQAARAVMERSIESGGSTMKTYVKADGTKGDYLEKFAQVFRREGQKCTRCRTEIIKIKVAGRGTHLCPWCQRLDGGGDQGGRGDVSTGGDIDGGDRGDAGADGSDIDGGKA